jgi:hypothetical protein
MIMQSHPTFRPRALTNTYNCMGMLFACRRTWIDPAHFDLIRNDDGYRLLREGPPMPGDVALYRGARTLEVAHVGLIVEVEPNVAEGKHTITVLSQFGANGEYLHDSRETPANLGIGTGGLKLEVWTER